MSEKERNLYQTILVNPISPEKQIKGRNFEEAVEDLGLRDFGLNTGNMLFVAGVRDTIHYAKEVWIKDFDLEEVPHPAAIMPASNFIVQGDGEFIHDYQRFLDHTDCPFTLAGLGAQSAPGLETPSKLVKVLAPAKVKFLKSLSDRAVSIGIRGEFTAECLELLGIHNYRIIGCPSFYKYLQGEYPKLPKPEFQRTQITITTGSVGESKILEMGRKMKSYWVMQMTTEIPKYPFEGQMSSKVWLQRRFPESKLSYRKVCSYVAKKSRLFLSMQDWDNFYRENKIQFAFGSRFHGNMAALRNGVPALWITHDSRTKELTETLHLPHITMEEFVKIKSIRQLEEICDYSDMYKYYDRLRRNYIEFLEENHVNVKYEVF